MELTLEQRLLRFLKREERDEERASRELQAQPIEMRVLEGECIEGAVFREQRAADYIFEVTDNASKFRAGDPVLVGDGIDLQVDALPMAYRRFDARTGELVCGQDPFRKEVEPDFQEGETYVLDRRPLGLRGRLRDAVRAAFGHDILADVLHGKHELAQDDARFARAQKLLGQTELNPAQLEAGAAAIATESLALVQGPPGTGKTRLLATVVDALCARTCRIALCAFTHRAVDNALLAIRRLAPDLPLFKLSSSSTDGRAKLLAAKIQLVDARRARFPDRGCVVAGTCFQLAKLHDRERFHYGVFDEAGQLPIPHALPGMLRASRWLFFGDHEQLPPVVTTASADRGAAASIFEHLHHHYGSLLLDTTYRMNEGVCGLVSDTFYGGRVRSSECASGRAMPFTAGGRLDEVLDPKLPVVWLRLDHCQPGQRSTEEANAVADLVEDLVRQHHLPGDQIAVVAPFRAQVRLIRTAIERKGIDPETLTIETVERIQGQEREVVLLSLGTGDPATSKHRGAFHLSLNRLNVALSRARTKAVLVGSCHAFDALPADVDALRMASRCKELRDRMKQVDLTRLYVSGNQDGGPGAGRSGTADGPTADAGGADAGQSGAGRSDAGRSGTGRSAAGKSAAGQSRSEGSHAAPADAERAAPGAAPRAAHEGREPPPPQPSAPSPT
ncbi:MAG: DEAD/DEAH box helicase [Planctomycetota bacterium]